MNNPNISLTIVLPSVRPDSWGHMFQQIVAAVGLYDFELIAIGPFLPPLLFNAHYQFKYISDYGSPARCFQIASILAKGKYITWIPDDALIEDKAYAACITLMESKDRKDGMTILYSEGAGFTGTQDREPEYWTTAYHDGFKLKKITSNFRTAPIFMYNTDFLREIGGLDCRYEHINMNAHDLAFRVQRNGGVIHYSPGRVLKLNWQPWHPVQKTPIQEAFLENDSPLFNKMFDTGEVPENPVHIDYDNWKNADYFWKRRFKPAL